VRRKDTGLANVERYRKRGEGSHEELVLGGWGVVGAKVSSLVALR